MCSYDYRKLGKGLTHANFQIAAGVAHMAQALATALIATLNSSFGAHCGRVSDSSDDLRVACKDSNRN